MISESGGVLHLSVVQRPAPTDVPTARRHELHHELRRRHGQLVPALQPELRAFSRPGPLPPASLPGLQETLWLYPEDETLYGPFPDSGEIDYGEFYSSIRLRRPGRPLSRVRRRPQRHQPTVPRRRRHRRPFNTYALLWTPTTITTYFNGVACTPTPMHPIVHSPDVAPAPFDQPFFLAFTAAPQRGRRRSSSPARPRCRPRPPSIGSGPGST